MSSAGTTLEASILDRLRHTTAQSDVLQSELEHLHRLALIGTLAAGVAHEINNILTPVLAYAQLAQSPTAEPDIQRKALHKALRGAEQVTTISEALLGFAARSGNDQTPVANIADTYERTIDCLGRDPARDGIKVVNHLPGDLWARIRPVALQQVFMNLILNSLHVLPKGRGRLEIGAEQRGGAIRLQIRDNGPGIPQSVRERLFEPFVTAAVQGADSRSTGTGLGLAVCKLLIEEANGSIEAESAPGEGTTFTIHVPASTPTEKGGNSRAA